MNPLTRAVFVLTAALLLAPSAPLAEAQGHWRFTGVEVVPVEPRVPDDPRLDRETFTISPGGATHERQGGQYEVDYRVQAQWDAPPGILIPGQEVTLGLNLHVTNWQWSHFEYRWGTSLMMIAATRPFTDAAHVSDRAYWFHYEGGRIVGATVGTDGNPRSASERGSFTPVPGDALRGLNYLAIRVVEINRPARVYYIYEWRPGPPDPDAEPPLVPGAEDAPLTPPVIATPEEPPAVAPPAAERDRPERVTRVTYLRGNVMAFIDGEWVRPHVRMILPGDSIIRAGEGGMAEVRMYTGHVVRVRPGTTLEVPEPQIRDDREMGFLEIVIGKIWTRARRGRNFEVRTPSGIAGVGGTDFSVAVGENGNERIQLYSGALDIRPAPDSTIPAPEVTLQAGQSLWMQDGRWHGPAPLSPVQRAEGLILASDRYGQHMLHPAETTGTLIAQRQEGDWHHALHRTPGGQHGVLWFDGLPMGDIGQARLDTPFGPLIWQGGFNPDAGTSTGWLPASDAPAALSPQHTAPAPGDVGTQVQMMVLSTPEGRGSPLYAGPGTDHPVLLHVQEGDWIELQSSIGDWALVWHMDSDTEGSVPITALGLPDEPGAPPMVVIQAPGPGWVGLHPTPDASQQPIARLFSGMVVDLLERRSGWLQVMLMDGTTGWIAEGSALPFP